MSSTIRLEARERISGFSCENSVGDLLLPFATAVLVTACFAWAAFVSVTEKAPLFQITGTAAFILLIVFDDVRRQKISNKLTLPTMLLALVASFAVGGINGVLSAFAGIATALALFFVPFACRWIGAGDVKAVMALGALWGAASILAMAWWMIVIGGLMALVMVALQPGGLRDLSRRWLKSAWLSLRLKRIVYLAPENDSVAATGLPFAVAIGLGCAGFQLWGSPWF